MKHIFIINPAAGKDKAEKDFLPKILDTVKKMQIDYEIHRTMGAGDAANFVKGRCKAVNSNEGLEDTLRFYACGGDGTLNEVVNGAFGYNNVEIAMIPAGTGNDFVRNFSDSKGFSNIERQINGKARTIDVIKYEKIFINDEITTYDEAINSTEEENEINEKQRIRYGINMFNIGLDSNVASKAAEIKKNLFVSGPLAYLLGIGVVLGRKESIDLEIEFDDGDRHTGNIMLIAIANGCYCGGGFKGVPYAELDDGKMDISIVEDINRRTLVTLLSKYRKGTHLNDPVCKKIITYKKCKSLIVRPKYNMQLCTDGDITQVGEIKFEILPSSIKFSIPQGCE